MKKSIHICSAAALAALMAIPVHAAEPGTFILGASLNAATLSPKHSGSNESGTGLELMVGYRIGTRWSVLAMTSGARLDDAAGSKYTLGHLDALGRYQFDTTGRGLHPHIEGGFTRRTARFAIAGEDGGSSREHAAWSPTIGAGVSYPLTQSLSLAATLKYTFGEFSRNECPSSGHQIRTCATSTRLGLGVNWYPGRR